MQSDQIVFTREGYDKLKNELENLKSVQRPKIIEEIAEARAHGDLSENAEYHAARESQGFIEARIKLLEDHLARGQVIDVTGQACEQVRFGVLVTVSDEDSGETKSYRIVGDLEGDLEKGKISISSPIAKALLGKKIDDLVEVQVPKGIREYLITDIRE